MTANKTFERLGTVKKVSSDCKVYAKYFSGAIADCMKDYVKPL